MTKKTAAALFFTLVLPIALGVAVLLNLQTISDYIRLFDYEPPARIAEIRSRLQLTSRGETLFYVHDPKIIDNSEFSSSCPIYEESIVLGCYFTNTSIFIFDVDDSRSELQGVEEVTAAHEMLHAAYDRLGESEKERVNKLLIQAYTSFDDSSKIKKNIDEYRPQGETVFNNELHSIIGTEVAKLPQELEDYYAQYFEDRSVVVTIANNYADVFRALEDDIDRFDERLTSLSSEINGLESSITAYQAELRAQEAQLRILQDNPSAYNAKVASYNAIVREYNATIETYKSTINRYNDIVNERNKISAEQTALYDAIDAKTEETEN